MALGNSVRMAVIVGAPVSLIALSLTHGIDWFLTHGLHDSGDFIQYIVDIRGRWLAVHLAGLVVFPLLGIGIWLMLPPGRMASRISQTALVGYMVLYTAFDAVAGIGGAIVADYRQSLPADQQPILDGVIWSLMGESDASHYLAEIATASWAIAVLAAAAALWPDYKWRVVVPLIAGGGAYAMSHFPPYGPVAGFLLAIAAWQFVTLRAVPASAFAKAPADKPSHLGPAEAGHYDRSG